MNKLIKSFASVVFFTLPLMVSVSCTAEDAALLETNPPETSEHMKDTIRIVIGQVNFTAILESNAAANEFKKMLPLTVSMKDLNSNEKFYDFANDLPARASNPQTINSGDLMLWGSNTLVLFYKTFNTSYSYTRLGKIENATVLAQAVGSGNVTVTFELVNN